jgi:hypothetical protein
MSTFFPELGQKGHNDLHLSDNSQTSKPSVSTHYVCVNCGEQHPYTGDCPQYCPNCTPEGSPLEPTPNRTVKAKTFTLQLNIEVEAEQAYLAWLEQVLNVDFVLADLVREADVDNSIFTPTHNPWADIDRFCDSPRNWAYRAWLEAPTIDIQAAPLAQEAGEEKTPEGPTTEYLECDTCSEKLKIRDIGQGLERYCPNCDFENPMMLCPRCEAPQPDYDGLGVLFCEACGFCEHASWSEGKCDYCGKEEIPIATYVSDLAMEQYRDGVKRGREEVLAYLKGRLGADNPILLDTIAHFEGGQDE